MPILFINTFIIAYLLSIIIYISQGILYDGTWFSLLAGVYVLLFNIIFTAKYTFINRRQPLFPIHVFLLIWIVLVWAISQKEYYFQFERTKTITVVQHIIFVCTTFFSFYYLASAKLLKRWMFVPFLLLLSVIFIYNVLHYDVQDLGAGEYDYSSANNKAYPLTALMPLFVVFWKKKWIMFPLMIADFVFVVFCLKRGAMICAAAFLLISILFMVKQNLHKSFRRTFGVLLVIFILLVGLVIALVSIYENNILLQGRFDHGSDARTFIYNRIINGFVNSDFSEMLIGHGPISTLPVAQNYAHSDWLEMLFDFGIIGLLLYLAIPIAIFRYYKKNLLSYENKAALMMILAYILIRSTFSMCIYELESMLIWGLLGLTVGKADLNRLRVTHHIKKPFT